VPIRIENAENLGGIVFRLVYDSSVLEVTEITQGYLARSRSIQYELLNPGEIEVLVGTGEEISGDGILVVLHCKALGSAGVSKLVVQVTQARSVATGELLHTQVSEGSFSESGKSVKAPVITFSA
jgi:hypothetical protein